MEARKKIDIQRAKGLYYSTINATIGKYKTSTTGASNSHSGRPKALTESDKEFIHLLVKQNTRITIGETCQVFDKLISTDTVSRMLKESGYTHAKA